MKKLSVMGMLSLLALSGPATATLIDRGSGMIYDTDQDITWLQDANYASTSGYDADGRMSWGAATTWADNLVFGGYDDWRLVDANPSDINCSDRFRPSGYDTQHYGYNCTGSELGHLFYVDLGLTEDQSILSSTDADLNLFNNIQSYAYWSGTEYAPDTTNAWGFRTRNGYQNVYGYKNLEFYAWAVRSGDVAAASVPEPGTLLLMAAGLAGVWVSRRRRC